MEIPPKTDGQEKRHETGEKEQDQKKKWRSKKIVDVLANEEGKEVKEHTRWDGSNDVGIARKIDGRNEAKLASCFNEKLWNKASDTF